MLRLSRSTSPEEGQGKELLRDIAALLPLRLCVPASLLLAVIFIATTQSAAQNHRPNSPVDPVIARQMRDAILSAQHGDEQHALQLVATLLQQHPTFVPALKLQGMLLEDTGQDVSAAQSYRRALELSPTDSEMQLKVGIIDLVSGHIDESIALLRRRTRALPRDADANYYLAQAYHLHGDSDRALEAIRNSLNVAPQSAPFLQKYGELLCSAGQNTDAIPWLLKAQQIDASLPRINFDLAVANYNAMNLQTAEIYASKEAELHPNDIDNLALLASVQSKLSEWSDAKTNIERVLAARPSDPASWLLLGHCEVELKDNASAIDSLNKSLQLDPTQVLAHFLLSRAYAAQGNTAEAQHEAALHREMMQHISFALPRQEAERENTVFEHARQLLAAGLEDQAVKALQDIAKGPSSTPGTVWVYVGATYVSMGDPDKAERCFKHALQLDPKTRDAHTQLGILAIQRGDLSTAEQELRAELALDANHSFATAELGEVRYRQSRWSEAADLIARSKTTNPSLLYMLCDAYFHLGRTQNADLTAESLTAYASNEPTILHALSDLLRRNGQTALADRLHTQ